MSVTPMPSSVGGSVTLDFLPCSHLSSRFARYSRATSWRSSSVLPSHCSYFRSLSSYFFDGGSGPSQVSSVRRRPCSLPPLERSLDGGEVQLSWVWT